MKKSKRKHVMKYADGGPVTKKKIEFPTKNNLVETRLTTPHKYAGLEIWPIKKPPYKDAGELKTIDLYVDKYMKKRKKNTDAAKKSKPANLQKAKNKPKHYADGGLVKKFVKKRYDKAHLKETEKKVPTPRLKPKSKP